ncbi:hypothetical protein Slin15195_G086210 [Septoria linicola]|uniref:Transcription factor domain-containing protein n=1 Tax=Septoria linicola TaxID=215465 RepID=A0A9Q9B0M7_9PEZI|nr:hypothetical protein Slin14017_G088800 [Septoria linicola]USW55302.1 hypothetical protein Slin15195_G086210 [Septoria linicola]
MEPLANCISLVHMIGSPKGSRKLLWRNVRLECERMRADRHSFDAMTVLTAMQALSIYVLIRLDEGETEHNNLDVQLHYTVTILADRMAQLDCVRKTEQLEKPSDRPTWYDWLMEESRRRLSIVYRIINMLVYFEPPGLCSPPSDLILAPLPARKLLWEATEEQYESHMRSQEVDYAYAMAKTGGLVRLTDVTSSPLLDHTELTYEYEMLGAATTRGTASWEEWLADMDGFGGLIVLAASMMQ